MYSVRVWTACYYCCCLFFSSICGVTIWVLNLLSVQYAELFFIYYYVGGWCVTNSLLLWLCISMIYSVYPCAGGLGGTSALLSTMTSCIRPVVISGPSGSGKSTLLTRLFKEFPDCFAFSVSRETQTWNTHVHSAFTHSTWVLYGTSDELTSIWRMLHKCNRVWYSNSHLAFK